jgi:hypothetical protein
MNCLRLLGLKQTLAGEINFEQVFGIVTACIQISDGLVYNN